MAGPPPVLEFQEVTKLYTAGDLTVSALNQISLSVMQREVVVIMGPSGAGKTTFLTIAGALMQPTSGRVLISGIEVTALKERNLAPVRRSKIGFIFQSFNLLKALTALQNVELVLSTRGVSGKAAQARARALLQTVGVEQRQQNSDPIRAIISAARPTAFSISSKCFSGVAPASIFPRAKSTCSAMT